MGSMEPDFEFGEFIAEVCHEVNRAYCQVIGDLSQVPWRDAPDNIKQSYRDGVHGVLCGDILEPADSHRRWRAAKVSNGWVYGLVKDLEAKTHPGIVPFDELPFAQQIKDYLFVATARTVMAALMTAPVAAIRGVLPAMTEK